MPYIDKNKRDLVVDHLLYALKHEKDVGFKAGELNYCITTILNLTNPKTYSDYNTLIGVLECVKMEFYRRAIVPYENKKIKENGDVYTRI